MAVNAFKPDVFIDRGRQDSCARKEPYQLMLKGRKKEILAFLKKPTG
jgi:hypothetical protein